MYDTNWGRIPSRILNEMKKGFSNIVNENDMIPIFTFLGIPRKKSALAELFLWAYKNRKENEPGNLNYFKNRFSLKY